jgi:hypothetical protein
MERIPVDDCGEGNCCPICGSFKISRIEQFPLEVTFDLNTKKLMVNDFRGKRIYKPSNRHLALLFRSGINNESQVTLLKCRKCDWQSEPLVP